MMSEEEMIGEIERLNQALGEARRTSADQVAEVARLNLLLTEQYTVIDKVSAASLRLESLLKQLGKRNPTVGYRAGEGPKERASDRQEGDGSAQQ